MTATPASLASFDETRKSESIFRNQWGGDDLHVGIYRNEKLRPFEASRLTTDRMLKLLPRIKRSTRILVIQSGFGTTARYIANEHNCKVDCLNDDPQQNAYNLAQIEADELTKKMTVTEGNVDYMPYAPETFDFVISQDSFSTTVEKRQMFRAIHRVMKPEGRLIFSAIMRGDDVSAEEEAKLNNLPTEELLTREEYESDARRGFFQSIYGLNLSKHLSTHYSKLGDVLRENQEEISAKINKRFVERKMKTCTQMEELAQDGALRWGILMFQKSNG